MPLCTVTAREQGIAEDNVTFARDSARQERWHVRWDERSYSCGSARAMDWIRAERMTRIGRKTARKRGENSGNRPSGRSNDDFT